MGCMLGLAAARGQTQVAAPGAVTAIDVLLDPDATMVQHAEAANARLLAAYPIGAPIDGIPNFSLDATHRPHITVIQRYVRTPDLGKLYAALARIILKSNVMSSRFEAIKYYYIPYKSIGVAGIVVKPTAELVRLQQEVADAVAPFTVATGSSAAFATTPDDPNINKPTRDYVETFVPSQTGANYNPHVTTGVGTRVNLDKLLAEKFAGFTFSVSGISVYQLGNNGTARRLLKTWTAAP
jgi:hypothetical protein